MNNIKAKVLTMGRMALMLKNVRENKEEIKQAKEAQGHDKLPPGLLGFYNTKASPNITDFISQRKKDGNNEKFPVAVFKRR